MFNLLERYRYFESPVESTRTIFSAFILLADQSGNRLDPGPVMRRQAPHLPRYSASPYPFAATPNSTVCRIAIVHGAPRGPRRHGLPYFPRLRT